MSNMTKIIGATALGLSIAVAIPVIGHEFGQGMHGPHGWGDGPGPGHHMGMGMHFGQMHYSGNVEERLGSLKDALQLTSKQQPAWDKYEQALKTMTESHPRWGNAASDADTHFAQMEKHITQMKAIFEARKALYGSLTKQQKQTIDKYMPGLYGHHFGYNG